MGPAPICSGVELGLKTSINNYVATASDCVISTEAQPMVLGYVKKIVVGAGAPAQIEMSAMDDMSRVNFPGRVNVGGSVLDAVIVP